MAPGDDEQAAASLAGKVLKMKFWDDENGGKVRNNHDVVILHNY